jgi:hypothetical protein
MSQSLIDQIAVAANVCVEDQTQVTSVEGTNCLEAIYACRKGEAARRRLADSLFVMIGADIGADAVTDWLPAQTATKKRLRLHLRRGH